MRDAVLNEVLALQKLSLADLRWKYTELFPDDKAVRGNPAYFQHRIAYRLQELAYGGLSETAQAQLQKLSSEAHRNLAKVRDPLQVFEQNNSNRLASLKLSVTSARGHLPSKSDWLNARCR